jgi:hypothetical protein
MEPSIRPPVPAPGSRNLASMGDAGGHHQPTGLIVAASVSAAEGLLVLGYAVAEVAHLHANRAAVGVTTALCFALLGGALTTCAWFVARGRAWARSPILVSQLMCLGLAWSFLGGDTTWVSVALTVVAGTVLVGLLHPASMEALTGRGDDPT